MCDICFEILDEFPLHKIRKIILIALFFGFLVFVIDLIYIINDPELMKALNIEIKKILGIKDCRKVNFIIK
jgi:hypothetical protein